MIVECVLRLLFDLAPGQPFVYFFLKIDSQVEAKLYTLIKFENETDLLLLLAFSKT